MKTIFIICFLLMAGCEHYEPDNEVRHKYFIECLEKAPAGPVSTKYNDWSEVVSECAQASYYQSMHLVK